MPQGVKFYLDEDLTPKIAEASRREGIDMTSAHERGNIQLSDPEQLDIARSEGRCLVTRNARHFILLAREAILNQTPHAGIIVLSPRFIGTEIRTIVNRLSHLTKQYPSGLGPYDIFYL